MNASIKSHRVAEWIRNHDLYVLPKRDPLGTKDLHRLKVKGWKKYSKQMDREEKAKVPIFISDKIDFRTRAIKNDPEEHFIILKGRIHQEDINMIKIYEANIGALKYIRKILEDIKKDIDSNTHILGDFNTPLSKMDRSSKQNINEGIAALKKKKCPRSSGLN